MRNKLVNQQRQWCFFRRHSWKAEMCVLMAINSQPPSNGHPLNTVPGGGGELPEK